MPSPSLTSMMGFERKLVIGVGGMAISNNQAMILTTYSLGSCLGVTIYDPVSHVGGLLHAMAAIDRSDDYILVALPEDQGAFSGLPPNFKTVTYRKTDSYALNHLAFPWFLHRLAPSLVHIPLNQKHCERAPHSSRTNYRNHCCLTTTLVKFLSTQVRSALD